MIEWYKNAKREDTQIADRRVWKSKCGHYKVEEHIIRYGQGQDKAGNSTGIPTYYLAMFLSPAGWQILSEHRTRTGAVKQCEYFSEHGHKMPPRTKTEKAVKRVKAKRKAKREMKDD